MGSLACVAFMGFLNMLSSGEESVIPPGKDIGPAPALVEPVSRSLATTRIQVPMARNGHRPAAASGLQVSLFAEGLDHPRWIHVLPNGDVLVAESDGPPRAREFEGFKGFVMKRVLKCAGDTLRSRNRITRLRPAPDGSGAPQRSVFLEGAELNSPIGMALVGNDFYVANTDAIKRFAYDPATASVMLPGRVIATLPAGEYNHHWTKNLIASRDGSALYVTVGSNSDHGERGEAVEEGRAMIWKVELPGGAMTPFATGLRNPNGLAWEPRTGALWTVVNERDELGSDLVPDYLTSVTAGGYYGWPHYYYGDRKDTRVSGWSAPAKPAAIKPDYALGSHVAPLGLAFAEGSQLGTAFAEGAFIGEHGSWNRRPPRGYAVTFVPFAGGKPSGEKITVLDGFREGTRTYGRPVGVAFDKAGALLVADDAGGAVWRITR